MAARANLSFWKGVWNFGVGVGRLCFAPEADIKFYIWLCLIVGRTRSELLSYWNCWQSVRVIISLWMICCGTSTMWCCCNEATRVVSTLASPPLNRSFCSWMGRSHFRNRSENIDVLGRKAYPTATFMEYDLFASVVNYTSTSAELQCNKWRIIITLQLHK